MQSEDFSTLFDLLPIGAYRSTLDGRYLRANASLVKLNGYLSETSMLAAINDLAVEFYIEPNRRQQFVATLHAQGHVLDFVSEVRRHNTGQRIWIREHAHIVRAPNGQPLFIEGTVEDITAQQETQMRMRDNAELFRKLIQSIPDLVWLKDTQGVYQACNAAFERHFGESALNIIGKTDNYFTDNDMAQQLNTTDGVALQSGRPFSFEEELTTATGTGSGTFEIIKAPVRNAAGEIAGVLGMGRDITRRKHAESLLRETSEQFELAIISTDLGMWWQSFDQSPTHQLDERACAMLGLSPQETEGSHSWTERIHPDDLEQAEQEMRQHLDNQTPFFEAEYRLGHKAGHWVWFSSRGKVVQTSPLGDPLRMVGTLMDITERKKADEVVRQMAFQDALTGLPNRRLLMDRLRQALTASVRHKRCGALLFLDLDKFKNLNDTMGHDVGDLLLQQVSERILKSVRAVDTVARIGGDEFVVLIADLSENEPDALAHASTVGQKILSALNAPYLLGSHHHISTPSIGATLFTGLHLSPDAVLKQADVAMYEAKAKGRNSLQFYEESLSGAG